MKIRLHRAVYDGRAVDSARAQLELHGQISLSEEPDHWVVEVTHPEPGRAELLARELANMALGLTVDQGGVA